MTRIGKMSLVAALLVLAGCAATVSTISFQPQDLSWPEGTDSQRIAFVAEFSNAADLGIKKGFWGRIARLVAGARHEGMVRPMAVAATPDNDIIFVADPDARCVHRYDLKRGRYDCLTLSRNEALGSPIGLAVTADGRLYVTDSLTGGVYTIAYGEKWLQALQLEGELLQPTGITWDEHAGLLYVVDTGAQVIKVYRPDGSLQREIGTRGGLPGEVNFPTYTWADAGGELVVTDSLNFRIQRFDATGEFVTTFGKNGDRAGDFARPKGVAVDTFGHVYVVDALFHSMQIFDREGTLLLSVGNQGQEPGQFWLPNGIYITADNTIYIADSYNRRVQVFRYIGTES